MGSVQCPETGDFGCGHRGLSVYFLDPLQDEVIDSISTTVSVYGSSLDCLDTCSTGDDALMLER